MNKENLKKMADYILTIEDRWFDMRVFAEIFDEYKETYHEYLTTIPYNPCNTIGCVVGHCALHLDYENLIKNYAALQIDQNDRELFFRKWSTDFTRLEGAEWHWCFAGEWADTDNTPEGAYLRIMILLEEGLPFNFPEQIAGLHPLQYKEKLAEMRKK